MTRHFKLAVAAAAMAAAGGAHATLDTLFSANSSLTFVAYDRLTTAGPLQGSFLADLNFNLNDFLPSGTNALTQEIKWNFNDNTISINGTVATGVLASNNWSSEYSQFLANSNLADMRWGVVGGDQQTQRYVTTGSATPQHLSNTNASRQTVGLTSNMSISETMWLNAANDGTHATSVAGANFATPSETANFFPVALQFGTNGNWNNNLRWSAVQANGVSSRFYYLNDVIRDPVNAPDVGQIFTYGLPDTAAPALASAGTFSTFTFDQNTNTLTWAAPIPEPGTYAMLLAGLAAVGFVARRRSSI